MKIPQNDITPAKTLSPQEEALLSLCKQLLKSRLFRGYYLERRYVETVDDYRDIVALQRSERDLQKLLMDICQKLQMFYQMESNDIWIGITDGALIEYPKEATALNTCIWSDLDGLAFGQYWFMIRNVRFRNSEIVLKLKMVRPFETEIPASVSPIRQTLPKTSNSSKSMDTNSDYQPTAAQKVASEIGVQDFVEILYYWGRSIKQSIYDFMTNEISRENIKDLLRFLGLLTISLISGSFIVLKYLGAFVIRFMFEFSRFTHTSTPIILQLIEFATKIVGGFYILLTMIWRDFVGTRARSRDTDTRRIEYNQPIYRSIEYKNRKENRTN